MRFKIHVVLTDVKSTSAGVLKKNVAAKTQLVEGAEGIPRFLRNRAACQ